MKIIQSLLRKVRVTLFIMATFISIESAALKTDTIKEKVQWIKELATPYKKPAQLNDSIQTATLKEVGLDEKLIEAMTDSITNGNYTNIHSILILRNNKLVYENYWPGNDVVRGKGFVGFVDHHRDSLHDLRSVTKSVVGAAILIAHAKGQLKSLNQRVFDIFPEYAKYDIGMKRQITVQHLLNMSAGFEWNEDIPYSDPKNSEIRMDESPNAVEFVLSQPLVNTPGDKYNYSGGCSQVLAAIIERVTKMSIDKFTEQHLFKPLGIEKYTWVNNSDGKPSAASGLRLRSRDMAKFGLLFLNNGMWKGKQIIPTNLVTQTLISQISTPYADSVMPFVGYSNQFWIYTENIKGKLVNYVQAQGNGGQIIHIDKQSGIVLIVTAGNYNSRDLRKSSYNIFPDFIYPAIIKGTGTSDYKKPIKLDDGIQTATLKEVGMDEKLIEAMTDSITNDNYTNVHSVLIARNNKLVYEQYWPGEDESRMKGNVGYIPHHSDSLHDIRSISKSITSAAIMIAHAQGKIKSLNQRVFDFFPQYAKYDTGLKREITIQHLLNMNAGLFWDEDNSFNDSLKIGTVADAYDFILRQPMVNTPGEKFVYSSGYTQLLSAILEKASGMKIEEFTATYLFQPLGITNYEWTVEKNGLTSAWAGLRMRSRDLLKFGLLYLNNGKWEGKQIIPEYLVAASLKSQMTTPHGDASFTVGYGNQFWTYSESINNTPASYVQAHGNGGQIMVIDKQNNLVMVTTSGNYDWVPEKSSYNLYYDMVFGAVRIPSKAQVNKIEHFFASSPEAEKLFQFFSNELGLPVVWNYQTWGDFSSGGVTLGNVAFELVNYKGADSTSFNGIALEPRDEIEEFVKELDKIGIAHDTIENNTWVSQNGTLVGWSTVGPKGLLPEEANLFICDYKAREMVAENRKKAADKLKEINGGGLGVISLNEIVVEVTDLKKYIQQLEKLPGIVQNKNELFSFNEGPSLHLIKSSKNGISKIVIAVRSLPTAKAFLESKKLLGTTNDASIFILPEAVDGLQIELVEKKL